MLRSPALLSALLVVSLTAPAWAEAPAPAERAAAPEAAQQVAPVEPLRDEAAAPVLPDPKAVREPEIPRSEPPELAAEELNLGWALFRTFIALAMVVALAYLLLNVGLRRLLGIRAATGASVVTVLERVALDQKRSLFVVEAAGEVLLLGGAENSLSLITKLDRAHLEQAKTATAAPGPVQLSPLLKKLLGRQEPPPPPPPAA